MTRSETPSRGGRPAAASPDDVLAAARRAFTAGHRVDVRAIAESLGVSRTSIYRWFGKHDGLMGAVLAAEFRQLVDRCEARDALGGERIRLTVLATCATFARHTGFTTYVGERQLDALRVITARDGQVQPAAVARLRGMIERAVAEDGYQPRLEPELLAYTLTRLIDGFVYTAYDDASVALNTDMSQLDTVLRALL
ncbi:MAG: QsdR family transcriptional regulator [Marmoricola sp.]